MSSTTLTTRPALALKYRPRRFEDLIGQEMISQTLSLALDTGRLVHAYLFSGLRGSGKTSTARIFSKALSCENGPSAKPCEVCDNCKMANEGRHIDIIEMDAASSRKIDDIRDLIEQTKYKPSIGRYKIFIIDEVHMLTKEAFNALLKTLEEPPEYVKFILATTDPLKLPATILSRTQHFRFKKINRQDILHHLEYVLNQENVEYDVDALDILSRSGGGSLRDTLTLLDQSIIYSKGSVDAVSVSEMLGIIDPEFIERIFTAIFNKDEALIKSIAKELESYEIESVVDELIAFLKERMGEDARFSAMITDRFFRILSDAKMLLAINSDGGFVITLCFFKMLEALKVKDIDAMIEELEGEVFEQNRPLGQSVTQPTVPAASTPTPSVSPQTSIIQPKRDRYEELLVRLGDRSYALGECFKTQIALVSFENNRLILKSKAKDECQEALRKASGVIKQFVQEIYGQDTGIKIIPWEEEPEGEKVEEPISEKKVENGEFAQSSSTVENIETDDSCDESSSCVQNAAVGQGKAKELDREEVLNHPMVKKAQELYDPERIVIQSKI